MNFTQSTNYYSNGKLLITGEYAVLNGALSLALPSSLGQKLIVQPSQNAFSWEAFDADGKCWFNSLSINSREDEKVLHTLQNILSTAATLNPHFASVYPNCAVQTLLTFPRHWGLGTSSTLINNIAQWAEVNPYELLFKSFGGSGYDIACAKTNTPLLYRLKDGKPETFPLRFLFPHTDSIYFVYLNNKQNSKEGITHYRSIQKSKQKLADSITRITERLVLVYTIDDFCYLLEQHEQLIGDYLGISPVKERLFPDFNGTIKSLGAWGGDFVLAISEYEDIPSYFNKKGYNTCIPYKELIITPKK